MILAVVYIHGVGNEIFTKFNFTTPYNYIILTNITKEGISRVAVPLFFLISGFLFFSTQWNLSIYSEKLKRRIRSLLIPYLMFNIITMAIIGIMQWVLPSLVSGNYKPVFDYDITNFLLAFWRMESTNIPYVAPLWFIRNLMVVMLFSPIVFYGIRKIGICFPLAFILAWLIDVDNRYTFLIPGSTCIAFFSAGAWIRINGRNMVEMLFPYRKISFILYPLLLIAGAVMPSEIVIGKLVDNVAILVGIVATINLVSWGINLKGWHIPAYLTSATFFVFAAHVPYIGQLSKVIFSFIPSSVSPAILNALAWVMHLTIPLIFTGILVVIYHLLKNLFPRFTAVLVGDRG